MERKKSWLDNPSKEQACIVFFIWFTGVVLFMFSATTFLTESPFQKENLSSSFILFVSTITMMPVCFNYLKKRKDKQGT